MKWYSIRVIEASTHEKALEKLLKEKFNERDPVCDRIIPASCVIVDDELDNTVHRVEGK